MFKLFKNNKAVSQVLGFVLSLGLTATVVIAASFLTSTYVDENTESAAQAEAENIANRVVNLLVNAYLIKEQYPDADYSTTMDVPSKLVNHFDYTITVNNYAVIVSSNDGRIKVTKDFFDISDKLNMHISGSVGGGEGKLTVYCYKTDYVYRFDFGTEDSTTVPGYTKITQNAYNPSSAGEWDSDYNDRDYRIPISIDNSAGPSDLYDFQVLIELTDTNFDHSLAKPDGSDIGFVDGNGNEVNLDFWIEQWYPYDTHKSRIWVEVPLISAWGIKTIYMYYGSSSASSDSNGEKTFLFFDDFNLPINEINSDKWQKYFEPAAGSKAYISNNMLVLENTVALKSNHSKYWFEPSIFNHYIIETKTKAISTSPVEGGKFESGLFARNNDIAEQVDYMKRATILSSGNFSDSSNNLAVQEWNSGGWWDTDSADNSSMQVDTWYRLRHDLIDATTGHIYRYLYENNNIDGETAYSPTKTGGCFGPCIADIESSSNLKAYFDWIYVRKYADPMPTVSTIGGIQSQDFYWSDNTGLGSDERPGSDLELGKDFVYSTSSNYLEFVIEKLDKDMPYSITLTIGDIDDGIPAVDSLVDNIEIYVDCENDFWYQGISCKTLEPYYRIMTFSNVYPNADESIIIKFKDTDGDINDRYWALCSLTIEQGERTIKVEGGIS